MILKLASILTVTCAVQSASYHGRNIPVEVRYHDGGSNLSEKIQLLPSEISENQPKLEALKAEQNNQVKNEKLQEIQHKLDEEKQKTDLLSAEKASLENDKLQAAEETGHRIGAHASLKAIDDERLHSEELKKLAHLTENLHEPTQLSSESSVQGSKHLPGSEDNVKQTEEALANLPQSEDSKYIPEVQENETSDAKPIEKLSWLHQAQNYVEKGLEELKLNFKPANGGIVPKPEFWEKLDTEVRDYFNGEINKLSLKQQTGGSQQNFFQNLANGFQQVTNNFIQGFQGNGNATGQEDDSSSQQGPWQGFVGYFQGGVQNLVSTVQNFGQQSPGSGNSTVLGDNGAGSQSPPFFGGIITNVQQFFQGAQNTISGGNGTQSDSSSQGGFFQGAINQFNQVVDNFRPSSPNSSAQSDEAATNQPTQAGPIQQVFQQFGSIGTAFNQFIQGGGSPPSSGSEDDSSTSAPSQNFIQSIGQNIGNAFQNIQNQFRPPTIPSVSGNNSSSNPISGIAGQIQQVAGQASGNNPIENLIPGSAGNPSSSSKQPADQSESEESNEIPEKSSGEAFKEEPFKEIIEETNSESKPSIIEITEQSMSTQVFTESTQGNKIESPIEEADKQPMKQEIKEEDEKLEIPKSGSRGLPVVDGYEPDNIEEIIDIMEDQGPEESKKVETTKVETMEATE